MEDLFQALVFLWSLVGLFILVQGLIWLQGYVSNRLEERFSQPKVWKWRRK